MSLGNTNIHQQGEIPEITKLPNGRIRVVRRFVKFTREDVDNTQLGTLLGDFGDLDTDGEQIPNQGYTNCRLISVEVEQSTKRSAGTDEKDNVLVQTYETLTDSFVEITDPIVEIGQNGLKKITRVYRATSETASTGVVGTTEYTSGTTVTTLASSKIEDNTAFAELTEVYLESGIIRVSVERDSDSQIVVVNCIGLTETEVSNELTTLIGNHEFTSEVTEDVDGFETNSFTYKIKDLTTLEATSDDLNLIRKIELSEEDFDSGTINGTELTFDAIIYTLRKEEINNIGIIKKRARVFAVYDEDSFPSNELYEIDRTYGIAIPVARQTVPAATATGSITESQAVQIEPIDSFRSLSYKILKTNADALPTQIWYEKRNVSVFPSELDSIKIVGTQSPTVVINYREPPQVGLVAKLTRKFHWGVPDNADTVIGNNYNPQPFSDAIEVEILRESTSVTESTSENTGSGTSANTSNSTSASQGTTSNTSSSNSSSQGTSNSSSTSQGTSSGTSQGTSQGTSSSTSQGTNSSTNSGSSTSQSSSSGTSQSSNSSTSSTQGSGTNNTNSSGTSSSSTNNSTNSNGSSNTSSNGTSSNSGSSNTSSNGSSTSNGSFSSNSSNSGNSSGNSSRNVNSTMQTNVTSTGSDTISNGTSNKNTQSTIDAVPSAGTPTRYTQTSQINGTTNFNKTSNGNNATNGTSTTNSTSSSSGNSNQSGNRNSSNNTNSSSNVSSNSTNNSNSSNNTTFNNSNNSINTSSGTSSGTNNVNSSSTSSSTGTSTNNGSSSGTSNTSGTSTSTSTGTSSGTSNGTVSSTSSSTSSNTNNSTSSSQGTSSGTNASTSTSSGTSNNTSAVQSQSTGTSQSTSSNTSESTSTTETNTKTIISVNMRACLRTAKTLTFDGQTISIPATVPTAIPRDQFIEIERSSSHWKYNIWVEQIVEVKLPALTASP